MDEWNCVCEREKESERDTHTHTQSQTDRQGTQINVGMNVLIYSLANSWISEIVR